MSIARIQSKFGVLPNKKSTPVSVKFNISDKLYQKLEKFGKEDALPIFENEEEICLNDLQVTLNLLNESLTNKKIRDEKKAALEKYKTCIMQSILLHLEKVKPSASPNKKKKAEKPSGILHWFKVGFLILVSLIGLVEGGIGGFLGFNQLILQLIPQISNVWLITATLGITAINLILFIAFEVDLLKNLLGITNRDTATKILQSHENQIDLTNKINSKLSDVNVITQLSTSDYKQLVNITSQFNQDVESKKTVYKKYNEHLGIKILRWTLTGLGAVITALGSVWGATSLLAAIAAPLVGTPIGWIIIGGLVASSLVFYFAMQGNGMTNLFNSTLSAFNKVKEKLDPFTPKSAYDFNKVLLTKNVFKNESHQQEAMTEKTQLVKALDLDNVTTKRKPINHTFFSIKRPLSGVLTDYDCGRKAALR